MDSHMNSRAQTLVEALPYIQKYYGKTVVIKYGGNAMVSEELQKAVISDIILLSLVGIRVVVVHGGGPDINEMLEKTGKQSRFVNGLRYTDEETMDIVQMVLCGRVSKNLVSMINRAGGRAIGICGMDDSLIQAKKMSAGEDYGLVGEIVKINPALICSAHESGMIPVVSTVAQGVDEGASYNINADTAAAEIAVALGAEKLILLTDTRGLLRDAKDESTLISVVSVGDIPAMLEGGSVVGGMIPKLQCCRFAVEGGVNRAHILDGRLPHSILIELLSDSGIGTMIH